MPKVSPALQWAMGFSIQYFVVYTVLAIYQTNDQFASDAHLGTQKILETACITVTYAAMLIVLFGPAALMPAPQLTQGETENCKTPQLWTQTAMFDCVHAVPAQSVIVLTIPILYYEVESSTDEHGNLDMPHVASEKIIDITMLKDTLALARHMINVAPMLATLLIGERMHARQIDSKLDSPHHWVQVCFYNCITSVCVQTLLVILVPFCSECECKKGPSESDVVFVMENRTLAAVVTVIRYLEFLGPYGDFTAVSFKIGEAAKKLSNASDPFLKDIVWLFDPHIKPLPAVSFTQSLKAVDQTIVMGKAMDGNLLKATAEAHHKAIGSIDAKNVTSAADYEAVNAALDHAVAFVPTSKVMDVYSAWAEILNEAVPNKLVSTVNLLDVQVAAKAFYESKDLVEITQREAMQASTTGIWK